MTIGCGSAEVISEREWMPSVESFFGGDAGPIMNVSRPESVSDRDAAPAFALPFAKDDRDVAEDCRSERSGDRSLNQSTSMKSCVDPPLGEEEQRTPPRTTEMSTTEESPCNEADVMCGLMNKKLSESGDEQECKFNDWPISPTAVFCDMRSKRRGTFDAFSKIWEQQRDLLLERLKAKDCIIRKQTTQLIANAKTLQGLVTQIDGMEAKFNRDLDAATQTMEQYHDKNRRKAESLLIAAVEVDHTQSRMKKDLQKVYQSAQTNIHDLESALHNQELAHTKLDLEKEENAKKLKSVTAEVEAMTSEVIQLKEELAVERSRSRQLQQRLDALHAVRMDKVDASQKHPCSKESLARAKAQTDTEDAALKENTKLKREALEMGEELVDLREHCDELESQVRRQQEAFQTAQAQLRDLEILKTWKQELTALLAVKQKSIKGLKQTLSNRCSKLRQQHSRDAAAEVSFLEEGLNCQQRCDELEALLVKTQTERDFCKKEMHKFSDISQSLSLEARKTIRATEKLKKENAYLKKTINCQKSEIATLQTNLRVETLKTTAHHSKRRSSSESVNNEIIRELLKAKVELAEMGELVIRLRREIWSSTNNNKPTSKGRFGYHFIRRAITCAYTHDPQNSPHV